MIWRRVHLTAHGSSTRNVTRGHLTPARCSLQGRTGSGMICDKLLYHLFLRCYSHYLFDRIIGQRHMCSHQLVDHIRGDNNNDNQSGQPVTSNKFSQSDWLKMFNHVLPTRYVKQTSAFPNENNIDLL